MQNIENKVDKLQNHLAAIDNRIQSANISKSDIQLPPTKNSEISSMRRKTVKKAKGNSWPRSPASGSKKSVSREKNKRK
jgi:hypothetical protein